MDKEQTRIGPLLMKRTANREDIMECLNKRVREFIREEEWALGKGKYVDSGVDKLLALAEQCNVRALNTWSNNCSKILNQVCKLAWPRLKTLILVNNHILTLESISSLNIPHLDYLDLSNNLFTNVSLISKCQLPSLQALLMINCIFESAEGICTVNAPKLRTISLFSQKKENNNIRWTAKTKLSRVNVNVKLALNQNAAVEKLSNIDIVVNSFCI